MIILKEIQIKTTLRYHFFAYQIGKNPTYSVWWGCRRTGTFIYWFNLRKAIWFYPSNIQVYLPFDATTPFLGIYSIDKPAYKYNDLCVELFITILFVITKGKKLKYLSIWDWLNRLWYIYTMNNRQLWKGWRSSRCTEKERHIAE